MSTFVDPDPNIQMRGETLANELYARLDQLEPQHTAIKNRVDQLNQTLFDLQSASRDDVDALNMNEQYLMLSDELESLSAEDERLTSVIAETEDRLEQGDMSYEVGKDPDLVMVPFLRIMVQGDYERLTNEANDYINTYPDSPFGYYFLAKALWSTGKQEDALLALKSAYVNDSTYDILLKDFRTSANSDSVAYLSNMKIMHNNQ
jgi:TolA-binding protein